MHYYQFNIGDYHSHTSRLSPMEDIIYRRLLDLYYLNEQPLNECSTDVARDIGMQQNQQEVDYILNKYFSLNKKGFTNKRVDLEIKHYKSKLKLTSKAGIASGVARKKKAKQTFNGRSTDVQQKGTDVELTNNHKPITNNHIKERGFTPPTLEEIKTVIIEKGYTTVDPDVFFNHYESNGWKVGKNKMVSYVKALAGWHSREGGDAAPKKSFEERHSDRSWAE